MKVHSGRADFMAGLLAAVSPWLFDFDEYVYLPHLKMGITELLVAMCSASVPQATPRWMVIRHQAPALVGANGARALQCFSEKFVCAVAVYSQQSVYVANIRHTTQTILQSQQAYRPQ